jgi:hypothetical protein
MARRLVLAHGDACEANLHMHAIAGDLPYGIQHFGEIATMLSKALPVWEGMLLREGQ